MTTTRADFWRSIRGRIAIVIPWLVIGVILIFSFSEFSAGSLAKKVSDETRLNTLELGKRTLLLEELFREQVRYSSLKETWELLKSLNSDKDIIIPDFPEPPRGLADLMIVKCDSEDEYRLVQAVLINYRKVKEDGTLNLKDLDYLRTNSK